MIMNKVKIKEPYTIVELIQEPCYKKILPFLFGKRVKDPCLDLPEYLYSVYWGGKYYIFGKGRITFLKNEQND